MDKWYQLLLFSPTVPIVHSPKDCQQKHIHYTKLDMSWRGTSDASTPEVERPSVSRYQVFNFVANILVIIVLLVLFKVFESLDPFKRGFFCDDESIAKPYRTETISFVLLIVLAIIFIFLVVSDYLQ